MTQKKTKHFIKSNKICGRRQILKIKVLEIQIVVTSEFVDHLIWDFTQTCIIFSGVIVQHFELLSSEVYKTEISLQSPLK